MVTRQENALKTRQKLLSVTDSLIRKNGFNKLSVEDITKQAGVATGTFYTYFSHKEDIVFEICKNLFNETKLKLDEIKNSDITERLYLYFECFLQEVQSYQIHIVREWIKGIVEKNTDRESIGIIKWNYDNTMLKSILDKAVQNGELKIDTPTALLTHIIITQLYGMLTCWCMSDGKFSPEKEVKNFCDVQLKTIIDRYKSGE